jgi:hypothetical protein
MVKNVSKSVGYKLESWNPSFARLNIKLRTQVWIFLEFARDFSWKILKFSSKMVKTLSKSVWVKAREYYECFKAWFSDFEVLDICGGYLEKFAICGKLTRALLAHQIFCLVINCTGTKLHTQIFDILDPKDTSQRMRKSKSCSTNFFVEQIWWHYWH